MHTEARERTMKFLFKGRITGGLPEHFNQNWRHTLYLAKPPTDIACLADLDEPAAGGANEVHRHRWSDYRDGWILRSTMLASRALLFHHPKSDLVRFSEHLPPSRLRRDLASCFPHEEPSRFALGCIAQRDGVVLGIVAGHRSLGPLTTR